MRAAGAFLLAISLFQAISLLQAEDYLADGMKALDANQPAAAEPLLRKAVEAAPADYAAHFNLSLSLSLQHKDAEAISELRRTLELKPALYEADLNLGILLLRNQQASDALPLLRSAVEAKPKESRPNRYYAQALLETGDLPQAAERFRDAGYKEGLLAVAAAYEKSNRKDEAIALYREFPDNPAVRERLGQLLIDNRDTAAAIPDLEEAVRQSPTTANRLALADAYRQAKQTAKMIDQLRLASAADPDNFDLRMSLGRALRDQHQMAAAAAQFFAAAKLRADAVPAWNELASALILNQNYAEGLVALDRIRALGKEIPGDLYLRAITLDKLKQRPQALAAYQQFLAVSKGAFPDQEFLARQRARIIESELRK
jgi:predicted Zn-dependent protease